MIYVAIDEGYCVTKLSGLTAVLNYSDDYYTKEGKKLDLKTAKIMLKGVGIYLYAYNDSELDSVRSGELLRRDWDVKIELL